MSPYVVTLAVDDETQARWDADRTAWFPAGRTRVGAHVTLFHAVPGDRPEDQPGGLDVDADLAAACARSSFEVRVSEVVGLGRGVAYRVVSDDLAQVHAVLRKRWREHLTRQDAQGFRPHVTVQNEVSPERARDTLARLRARFTAYDATAVGIDLWRYEGGPWAHQRRYEFEG